MSNLAGPDNAGEVQFEKAEYGGEQVAAGGQGMCCASCKQALAGSYFTANDAAICGSCHENLLQGLKGGGALGRVLAAGGLGLLAGLVGAAIWFAIRRGTGYEIGLVAVAVGIMVGLAVRKGSKGRGGWFYQTMAVVLTYCCISAQYAPDIIQEFAEQYRNERAVAVQGAGLDGKERMQNTKTETTDAGAAAVEPAAGEPTGAEAKEPPSVLGAIVAIAILAGLVLALALAVPFLGGVSNIIGLLIIGFALYEAWKLNKSPGIKLAGPFQLTTPTPPLATA